jgi:hypothetical protein
MEIKELQQRVEALELVLKKTIDVIIGTNPQLRSALSPALRDVASGQPDGPTKDMIERLLSLPERQSQQ